MMQAVVLYDSQYGNTKQIAETVAEVLERRYHVRLVHANDASSITERPDLLVVGSPTYHRRGTNAIWAVLRRLSDAYLDNLAVAVFDTRYQRPRFLTGSAALGIARNLSWRGAKVEIAAESFFVVDKEGPLVEDELDRAHRWAQQVLYLVSPNPPHNST